jgi:hypothetical protein
MSHKKSVAKPVELMTRLLYGRIMRIAQSEGLGLAFHVTGVHEGNKERRKILPHCSD